MTTKIIYLAKRNPSIEIEDFPTRWKAHSALAATFPGLKGRFVSVAQCSRVLDSAFLASASNEYDGVNLLTMVSREAAVMVYDDPDVIATMRPDELRVFSDYVSNFSMLTKEHVICGGPIDVLLGKVIVITFLKRKTGMSSKEFQQYWRDRHAAALMKMPNFESTVIRLVQNTMQDEPPAGFDFDGISELWFENLDEARRFFGNSVQTFIKNDIEAFCEPARTVTMLTHTTHARQISK